MKLKTVVAALPVLAISFGAGAQYPTKPIRVIAPYPAGGTSDTIARILGQKMTEAWKTPIIVENRAGVNGSIGASIAAKAPADGYTLLVGNTGPMVVNQHVYKAVTYTPKDFAAITLTVVAPQIVVVHPSVPAKSFREFIGLVRKYQGKINYGSSGPGSISHLSAELFKLMTRTDMLHVPFKGSALITTALLSGELDVVFSDMAVVLPHVQAGRLRALAVTGPKPTPLVPGVPTVAEQGVPDYAVTSWWGMFSPAGTPQPVVARLFEVLARSLEDADVKQRFATLGVDTATMPPEQFRGFVAQEYARYGKLVRDIGVLMQ